MGKKDVVSGIYLGAADRIADLLNNELFRGAPVISASDIVELDRTTARTVKDGERVVHVRVVSQDLVREVRLGLHVMLFAIEEQSDIHYAMPLKILNGDTALYDKQWREIRRRHQKAGDLSGAEYLSGFSREDRLAPVFSAVLYFGEKEWDGPLCLKDMMDLEALPEAAEEKIADYPFHLIDVRRYPNTERFRTDLRLVFGFLRRAADPGELTAYIKENTKGFSCLPEDAYDMIASMSGTGQLESVKKEAEGKEETYDMCKAIDMMMAESEERGIKMARKIFRLHMNGCRDSEIAEELDIPAEKVAAVLYGQTEQDNFA